MRMIAGVCSGLWPAALERYGRGAETACFRDALVRVADGAATHRIALMCSDKKPLDGHRTPFVARVLDEQTGGTGRSPA